MACSRLPARGRGPVADDPLVAERLAGDEPIPDAADGRDDAGAPIPIDRIGGEGDAGRGRLDHALDDHRHPSLAGGRYPAARAARALARTRSRRGEARPSANVQHRLEHAGVRMLGAVLRDRRSSEPQTVRRPDRRAPARISDCARPGGKSTALGRSAQRRRERARPRPSAPRDWPPCRRPRRHRPCARREASSGRHGHRAFSLGGRGDSGAHDPVDVVGGLIDR